MKMNLLYTGQSLKCRTKSWTGKTQLSFCDMGSGDEDWKRWEMHVRTTCSEEVLQAWVWMEINTLTKHLLTANTSETCTSDLLAGTEPHSRWHLTATAFVEGAKVCGAEKNVVSRDNPQRQHSCTKMKMLLCLSTYKNSHTTRPPQLFLPSPPFPPRPIYRNIGRNANSSSSFKSAFLDNIEEDHSNAVCLPLPCVHLTHIRSPWALLMFWYLLSLLYILSRPWIWRDES